MAKPPAPRSPIRVPGLNRLGGRRQSQPAVLRSAFCLPENDKLPLGQGLLGQAPQASRLALRGQTLLIRLRAMAWIKIYFAQPTFLPRNGEPPGGKSPFA